MLQRPKLLIIRLSSFGDILQALSVPYAFKQKYPDAEIHWVVRKDFAEILSLSEHVDKVIPFDRKSGLKGWLSLALSLRTVEWSHIYDAHNNLRSQILTKLLKSKYFARRSKERFKRFLQFKLGIKCFPTPYYGQLSFLNPLVKWGIESKVPDQPPLNISATSYNELEIPKKSYVAIMPSAAWSMKRWPITYWTELILTLKEQNIVLLGGPEDGFIRDLERLPVKYIKNLAGKTSLLESCTVVANAKLLISADTGLLHAADQLGVPAIALIGPTAFGYPSRKTSRILETQLYCKPCSKDGRGKCKNKIYQKCMIDIQPYTVASLARQIMNESNR